MQNIDIVKADLIAQIDKRLEDRIIESTNAELLKKLITNAESTNEAMMIAELGTTYKRTGFHFDKRLEKLGSDIKYLKKNEKLSFLNNADALTHKLIIGDNYDALQQLLITHRGMVDVIYIDPPYGANDMGEFANTNYTNSLTRDNLMSMLYPRLQLARQLLSENGIIFCSIDNKNYPYLKGLFDEVFHEQNCITTLHWKKKKQPSFLSVVAEVMEYIIVYSKNPNTIKKLSIESLSDSNKPVINASNQMQERTIRKGCRVKANVDFIKAGTIKNKTMEITYLDDVYVQNGRTLNDFRCVAKFRTNQENIDEFCSSDTLFITKNLGLRRDLMENEKNNPKSITDLILDWGQNQDGSQELKEIFGIQNNTTVFDNPKPTMLIKNLIKSTMKQDAVVLDFFAGSGTTGQAVLELNKEDEGNRSFILCTNNEITNLNPNGIAHDVTSKRLKRVMCGKCYDGSTDFKWLEKNEPYGDNLDVYDIESVNATEQGAGQSPFDVISETCYDMPKFTSVQEKIAWVCNNFENTQKYIKEEE